MPKTNLQRKASYYDRFIKEYKGSDLSKKYESFYTSLEKLVEISKNLNNPKIQMTPQSFKDLKASYKSVLKECSKYLKTDEKQLNDFEKSQKGIVKDIARVLYKDMKVLVDCNPMEPGSLSELISNSRSYTVHLKKSDIKKVGASLSSRIPMKTSNDKKGFFTPSSTYNYDKQWVEQIDKHIEILKKFPKVDIQRLENLKTNENTKEDFLSFCPNDTIDGYLKSQGREKTRKGIAGVEYVLGIEKTPAKALKHLDDDLELKEAIRNFIDDMSGMVNQYYVMRTAGIVKNSNLSDRNCAMTDMANLLGCSGILAKSVPMKIVVDNEIVEGVFMETVEGTDINRVKEDDIVLDASQDSFNHSKALDQLLDLQVLDYICGNIDRHGGNMIYQFEKGTDDKVYLKGIKGIDNDCAFGTLNAKDGKKIHHLVTPDKMQFIRKDTLNRLKLLDETTIYKHMAPYKLSEEEKKAILERVENVKEAVELGKIDVITEENYWESNSLKNKGVIKENYLGKMKEISEKCKQQFVVEFDKEGELVDKEIHYMHDRRMGNQIMYNNLEAIQNLKEEMKNSRSTFFDSSEYKMMKKRFDKIETLTQAIRKDFASPDEIPENRAEELEKAYMDLADKTNRYIELKKIIPSTENGKKRTEFARNLLNFASTTLNGRELNPEKEHDLKEIDPMEIDELEIDAMFK